MSERPARDEIWAELNRGEPIGAYERAKAALDAGDQDPDLRYLSVLALARSGATAAAAAQYWRFRLNRADNVDCKSLWARILKDLALGAPPASRQRMLTRAARAYARVYDRTKAYFPGINAATLSRLAGDERAAQALAAALLDFPELRDAHHYYEVATRAEALIILRRWGEAADALKVARALGDIGSLSTTRRQLSLLLDAMRPEEATARRLLSILRLPRVALLTGEEAPPRDERGWAARAREALEHEDVGFAVGTLWTGGAVALAEEALARGIELHVVLPFGEGDFLSYASSHLGPSEVERRMRCLRAAATVTSATADGDVADPKLIEYAALIAVGLARVRARRLSTDCVRLALGPNGLEVGDLDHWTSPGHAAGQHSALAAPAHYQGPSPEGSPTPLTREIRALLFADVFRFSTIPESRLPFFWSGFMADLAAAVDAVGPSVLYRNTWGDALFLVLSDIDCAADLALSLQERAGSLRTAGFFAPELRIGLHHGPVFRSLDPIRGVQSYFGTQVSRAARVEPVAPPGAVFVTEPFAAILATTGAHGFEAEFVGRMPLPKKYGEHRMYRLARRWPASPG